MTVSVWPEISVDGQMTSLLKLAGGGGLSGEQALYAMKVAGQIAESGVVVRQCQVAIPFDSGYIAVPIVGMMDESPVAVYTESRGYCAECQADFELWYERFVSFPDVSGAMVYYACRAVKEGQRKSLRSICPEVVLIGCP